MNAVEYREGEASLEEKIAIPYERLIRNRLVAISDYIKRFVTKAVRPVVFIASAASIVMAAGCDSGDIKVCKEPVPEEIYKMKYPPSFNFDENGFYVSGETDVPLPFRAEMLDEHENMIFLIDRTIVPGKYKFDIPFSNNSELIKVKVGHIKLNYDCKEVVDGTPPKNSGQFIEPFTHKTVSGSSAF